MAATSCPSNKGAVKTQAGGKGRLSSDAEIMGFICSVDSVDNRANQCIKSLLPYCAHLTHCLVKTQMSLTLK